MKFSQDQEAKVTALVDQIRESIDRQNRIDSFPERYVLDYEGELDYIDYEWQTRRYPVDATIAEQEQGEFAVEAGRSDSITDAAMYADDLSDRKRRAEYVHSAVDGRNVKKGEATTIPIPRRAAGVEELLSQLEIDEKRAKEIDIDALEKEIDSAVYDLFDLTEDEQRIVEDYLEVF